jgi:hypothetical protein|uniref:Uncharacterized protein n=1 Tax=viral metagenome TaxID=1070528 RepID=A0A6C0IC88_9ZZZZ
MQRLLPPLNKIPEIVVSIYIEESYTLHNISEYLYKIQNPFLSIKILPNKPYNINAQLRLPYSWCRI